MVGLTFLQQELQQFQKARFTNKTCMTGIRFQVFLLSTGLAQLFTAHLVTAVQQVSQLALLHISEDHLYPARLDKIAIR